MNECYGVRIPKPCPMKWEELVGDEKKRYCSSCELHVHNLSEMSTGERHSFLAASHGRTCVAFSAPRKRPLASRFGRFGLLLASLSVVILPGCSSMMTMGKPCPPKTEDSKTVKKTVKDDKEIVLLGAIVVEERPLWKRILWPFN